ncbi:AAC(3) family N-acetyltransferase [Paenibacillus tarimensis]
MNVKTEDISSAIIDLGLSNKPVCIHSSLRSFGSVDGGAESIVHAFLNQGCTILVPSFSSRFAVYPPDDQRPERNGCGDYSWFTNNNSTETKNIFTCTTNELDRDMGAIPKAVLNMQDRRRGNHPLNSFAAVGPLADELILEQKPANVYAPLETLSELNGKVILMGVGLNRLTLLHLAEKMAGRTMFRRWAKEADGSIITVETGGCSEGFHKFDEIVSEISDEITVGESLWRVFDVKRLLGIASKAIQQNPLITHCGNTDCERCNDAILGGPILF